METIGSFASDFFQLKLSLYLRDDDVSKRAHHRGRNPNDSHQQMPGQQDMGDRPFETKNDWTRKQKFLSKPLLLNLAGQATRFI
ncbi:MAG TPA: hypothetical protein VGO91_02935 [Pyrinomonadaceae bacterium]|nr:hypothetical protein [Pyrinomonadaceae bacterium]